MRDKLDRLWFPISLVLLMLVAFTGTAIAAGHVADESQSLIELAKPMIEAIAKGQWLVAAACFVVLATSAARKYLPDRFGGKHVRSALGGMFTAALITFATTLAAHGELSYLAFASAGNVAVAAIGGWMILHKIAVEVTATKWYQTKAPAWLKAVLSLVLAIIGSSAASKAKAGAAGAAAVEAKPSTGAAGIVAKPEEF